MLEEQIRSSKDLSESYDDLQAESLTLKQTNEEYKRTLASKVKEIMQLQRDIDSQKKHFTS